MTNEAESVNPTAKGLTAENRAMGARKAAKIRVPCPECNLPFRPSTLRRHILAQHSDLPAPEQKRCCTCRKYKPAHEFAAKRTGDPRLLQAACRACNTATQRKWYWANHERARATRRDYARLVAADPERHAIALDQRRQRQRREQGIRPENYRFERGLTGPSGRNAGAHLPAAPLLAFLDAHPGAIPERRENFLRNGQPSVSLAAVDRWLTEAGFNLEDVYPLEEAA